MPAVIPVETIDEDDDGFDWEAAVREIDGACQATIPSSTSYPVESSSLNHNDTTTTTTRTVFQNVNSFDKYNKRKPDTSRQSTLDNFIGRTCLRPSEENRPVREIDLDNSNERVCRIDIDPEAAKTWIYPDNDSHRDYQFSITKTALFSNTLVAVPTGLGKTLIAAVVMYNYFRWFPEGKIVFAAPSRPLVMQQIEACHNIVGIPLEWTIDMTGQTSPMKRACLWKSKRVFFVTPQVLEKDIQSGTCMVKNLVCLVIDEAHRALGNYSYSVAVRELMAIPVQLRILALTATPGSKQQTIQHIIDNLHISTLEYRNESDPDVSSYVHNRKLELIEVAMGQDADEINNLLSEVIRPFVARLSAMGVLQYRDFQTLSPCELLNSRDKFRQAPPPDLPHMKYGEVEGYFGVLITLYHIRKLLSSHGIRPAYEMLEEKSQQGSFARLMSRNEVIHKAKLLMQKSLSHGAPSPKLSKLTEVLIDHFKTKNPQSSRVIIFSNFRGSVRDIMNALGDIGDNVRATEFIGQSSGKTLRGQSQKVQQAVLEKFRAGGYNVIVATSIGEEGLDIMEVDLVICFDANISPLRMIQRMGRTGRKHDGRVVVLACEGSELKGYMRKQANGKAIGKHMQNGGVNSFRFHSSPRMIPHVFKPEVQFVKLSIEQFVHRGRKATDDHLNQTPMFADKLSDAETKLIAKYFHPNRENRWRLSLISFPHFQAFPSRVHQVMHSFKTGILIDAMQYLQEMSISKDRRTLIEDGAPSGQCVGIDTVEQHTRELLKGLSEGNLDSHEISPKLQSEKNILDFELLPPESSQNKYKHNVPGLKEHNPPSHSYHSGSDFVSVDALGKVLIISVPFLPLKDGSNPKYASASSSMSLNCRQEYSHFKVLTGDYKALTLKGKDVVDLTVSSQTIFTKRENVLMSRLCNSDGQQGTLPDGVERIPHTTNLMINQSNEGVSLDWTPNVLENKSSIRLVNELSNDFKGTELSPRLTNLIKSGVVPESPLGDSGLYDDKGKDEFLVPDVVSPAKLQAELLEKSSSPGKIELAYVDHVCHGIGASVSPINIDVHSPFVKMNTQTGRARASAFLACEGIQSPLANLTNNSCSKNWLLNSVNESETVEQKYKFRRLRKFGDSCKMSTECMKNNSIVHRANLSRSFADSTSIPKKQCRGIRKPVDVDDVRAFIADEAEVSSEARESDDEEVEEDSPFDDSFIDDRLTPTAASTQVEAGRIDMMAIYRRSLLSQSPKERQPNCSTSITPDSVAHISGLSGSGSSSGKTVSSLRTPQTESVQQSAGRNSALYQMNPDRTLSDSMPYKSSLSQKERERTENRKRKLSFHQLGSVPAINLNEKFSFQLEGVIEESSIMECQAEKIEPNGDVFYDDHFYEGLDLDAVEAQATILLRYKSDLSIQKQEKPPEPTQNLGLLGSPSFDLGI